MALGVSLRNAVEFVDRPAGTMWMRVYPMHTWGYVKEGLPLRDVGHFRGESEPSVAVYLVPIKFLIHSRDLTNTFWAHRV